MKQNKLLSVCILFILILTGCKNNSSELNDSIIYNSAINDAFVDSDKYIYGNDSISMTASNTIIKNKVSGKTLSFIRNPFYKDNENISYVKQIHIDDKNNKGYFMDISETNDDRGFSIMQFDLNTFEVKEIYREGFFIHKTVFLGIGEINYVKASKENDFSQKRTSNIINSDKKPRYFIDSNNIYVVQDDGIFKIDINSKKKSELIKEDGIKNVSYDGQNIYYINNAYELYKYSINTGRKNEITSNKSSYLLITKDKIMYTNLSDQNHIYIMDKDGKNNNEVGNSKAKNLNFDNEYIYYSNEDDNQCMYRIKYDGSKNEKMTDKPAYFIFVFKNYNKIYFWSNDISTNTIKNFSINKKDFTIQLLDLKIKY